jgi:prophage tail gpP-like protein
MPKPTEICTVTAFGEKYHNWKTIEVWRSIDSEVIDHAMLTAAEINGQNHPSNLSDLKLKPGDPVTVTLAGRKAIDGYVYLRQAAADAYQHGVQIGICSRSQSIMESTVDVNPGQYIDQTLQQIISACFGKVGVNFRIIGSPPGADRPFKRVSEHLGERRFDFASRLCAMRNIHMMDSANGIVGFRGATGGGLSIVEGKNMLRGRITLQTWDQLDPIIIDGMDHNNDSADANRATQGVARIPGPHRPARFGAEETGSQADMQDRANHEKDFVLLNMVDGDVTVPGWLTPSGDLWMEHLREIISVKSPLLLPNNTMQFMIKGIVHRQSDVGGTTTDILLCDTLGVGGGGNEPLRQE